MHDCYTKVPELYKNVLVKEQTITKRNVLMFPKTFNRLSGLTVIYNTVVCRVLELKTFAKNVKL